MGEFYFDVKDYLKFNLRHLHFLCRHGVFLIENDLYIKLLLLFREICDMVHAYGGQVYLDGANMNAQVS